MNQKAGDKVHFLYSTPECYTLAKNGADIEWPINEHDYMPLRTGDRWWTGFYSSRSNYKAYVRESYSLLAAAHQVGLLVIAILPCRLFAEYYLQLLHNSLDFEKEEFDLARAYAIGQHHDGITGTHAPYVTQDYLLKFSRARNAWFEVFLVQSTFSQSEN